MILKTICCEVIGISLKNTKTLSRIENLKSLLLTSSMVEILGLRLLNNHGANNANFNPILKCE